MPLLRFPNKRISPFANGEQGALPLHPTAFEKAGETFEHFLIFDSTVLNIETVVEN